MTRNLRGAYLCFKHDRKEDWDWLAAWQPSVIRLMIEGSRTDPASVSVSLIERVHATVPGALIVLRCWDVDDRKFEAHEAMVADPIAEAEKQLAWWNAVISRCGVPRKQLIAGLNNEVDPSRHAALYQYTKHALIRGRNLGVRLAVGVFSTGTPHLPGDGEYDINKFAELDPLVIEADSIWMFHEYMQPEGMYGVWTDEQGRERKDYSYLIGRHKRWPIKGKVIIGEWGIEGILYNRNRDPKWGNAGWLHFPELWPANRYADEYVTCVRDAASNVIGICPFISDYADHRWQTADLMPAYGEFLARKHLCELEGSQPSQQPEPSPQPQTVHMPSVKTGGSVSQDDRWQRSREFVRRWEGGYSDSPEDHGNWTGGRKGVGELKGTKFGISAGSYPHLDIRNLTMQQADDIYRRDYWQASGADKLPWPYCLLVFDTAVLHGVGTARLWAKEVGDSAFAFAARRLQVYVKMDNWHYFGAGWVRRVAELLEIAGS